MIGPINEPKPSGNLYYLTETVTNINWLLMYFVKPEFLIYFREKEEDSDTLLTIPGLYIYREGHFYDRSD